MHWDISYDSKSTAEQVRVVIGHCNAEERLKEDSRQMKRKPNQIMSRITNQSLYQFREPSYTATKPQWQSTIDMMKSSTEQRIFKKRETAMSDQSSSTDKSKANLEAVYPDMYRQVKSPPSSLTDKAKKAHWRQSTTTHTGMSTKKSTKILLKPPGENATLKSTGWSPKRTSKDDC